MVSGRRGGIDLGGTKIQAVVLDGDAIAGQARVLTPAEGPDAIVDAIVEVMREAAGGDPLDSIGIGTPGVVETISGVVSHAANVPGFLSAVPLGKLVSQRFDGVTVRVDNDVRSAVIGEHRRGAGRPYRDLVGVFMGTGVGGGLILEGRLRHGRGSAGEIGHTVVKDEGRLCACGRRGCLEAYAGRKSIEATARRWVDDGKKTALFDIMKEKGRDRLSSGVIARALDRGDKMATKLIDQAVWAMGIALASTHNLLDLEAIIIGGGLGDRLGQPFVDRVHEQMAPRVFANMPTLLTTELGDLSGAVGAAVLAAEG